jgi:hypothetical protein
VDAPLRRIIYEGSMTQLHQYLQDSGFASFQAAAIAKVTSGKITVEEVLRVLPHNALYKKFHPAPAAPTLLPTASLQK